MGTTDELLEAVKDKMFSAEIWQDELVRYEKQTRIVNIKGEDDGKICVRYVANEPIISGSVPAQPRLEDLYLWLFRQKHAGEEGISC